MIVITGATGNVGRPLVRMLSDRGEQVTATARAISVADVPPGVTVRRVDLTVPSTVSPAIAGAEAVFLLTPADMHAEDGQAFRALIDAVRGAGVARVVLLSSQGVATGRHPAVLEDIVRQSGLGWTILRPGGFASNALWWAEGVRRQRVIAAPFADVGLPVIDPADIAAVAAVCLCRAGHESQTYVLTGPEPITPRQQAAAISKALGGAPIEFVEQTRAQAMAELQRVMPPVVAERTLDALGAPTPEEQQVPQDLPRVLGRNAAPFAQWVSRHVDAFR